jgi:hydrophobic/amphiphilic exporter-1 (mainly G- bacteria), HAE1 family
LRQISTDRVEVEKLESTYWPESAGYSVKFRWGVASREAFREVLSVVNAFSSRFTQEVRNGMSVDLEGTNSGFLAISFYTDVRTLDELYELLEPVLTPRLSAVKDAKDPFLYNPSGKEIRVDLNPGAMAALQLLPRDIEAAITEGLEGRRGGSITINSKQYTIQMPRGADNVDQMGRIVVRTPTGNPIHLSDIANVQLGPRTADQRAFKTNGADSIILFVDDRPGGNIKRMAEESIQVVEDLMPTLPKDIHYRVLVDPSQFIRSAIRNVLREVIMAAMLAVFVLFLFLGSVRNVITAAIEIPISMVLAFIMMRLSGMNLNLISLGGLALSAGMNVDGSVVVMENIFRHFEMHPPPHDYATRFRILVQAVKEVRFAIIASTVSSLVVFLPLTFTSDLSYAILGDLAKAVVFSHGFSAIVALILVPTVRLQLMSGGGATHSHSPIEPILKRLENGYASTLGFFISHTKGKYAVYFATGTTLTLLVFLALPKLPREILGRPDTDWMVLSVATQGNTLLRQMSVETERIEREFLDKFGDLIQYTFVEVDGANAATIMGRLKDKSKMQSLWLDMQKQFTDTPTMTYSIVPWNPSEMHLPDPPNLRVAVRGGETKKRALVADDLATALREKKFFARAYTEPSARPSQAIIFYPHKEQWSLIENGGFHITLDDLADIIRVGTDGRRIGSFPIRNQAVDIMLHYPPNSVTSFEDVTSLPIGIGSRIIPMKALAEVKYQEAPYPIRREERRELFLVEAKQDVGQESLSVKATREATNFVNQWQEEHRNQLMSDGVSVTLEDPAIDLSNAVRELGLAVALSILLIFITLLLQFGSLIEPLLVLVSIPLGFIGVLAALWIFQSVLSLNSILGVILLNGIAVANSIILVDFIKRLVVAGSTPKQAAVEAARKRLRPILITSLTTVLGMLPVALGMGEGGRILQPLGVAVSGGLWISMGLTLFIVPALQVSYLEWLGRERMVRPGFWSKARSHLRAWRPAGAHP